MSYEFTHRGYRLVFENDESAADIFLDGAKVHTATETVTEEWHGDERVQVDVTTLVNAIRWISADIKARKAAVAAPAPQSTATTPNDPQDKVNK